MLTTLPTIQKINLVENIDPENLIKKYKKVTINFINSKGEIIYSISANNTSLWNAAIDAAVIFQMLLYKNPNCTYYDHKIETIE